MQVDLQVLDVHARLSGPDEVLTPIASAYRRFGVSADSGRGRRLDLDCGEDGLLRIGDRTMRLVPGVDPVVQVYPRFLNALLDRIGGHAVLHAGALVDPRGAVLLLAAPSGHGKTTLTLELLARGYRFLGDDYAPLDLERGTIEPFPRAVGVRPDSAASVPRPFREAAAEEATVWLFGKALVDVGRALGDSALAPGPAPLGRIVLLADSLDEPRAASTVELTALAADAAALEARFAAEPGVELVATRDDGPLRTWLVRPAGGGRAVHAVSGILEDERVLSSCKHGSRTPDFRGEPRAAALVPREAAEELGRELLNRRAGGALLGRYGGSTPRLFLDLAHAVSRAACWRVVPGSVAKTADLVEGLDGPDAFAGPSRRN